MHEGHRERMRDKYIKYGIDSMQPHEVLEMVLYYCISRGNTNEIAHGLINEFGSLTNVFDADVEDLCRVKGMGKQSAVLIKLVADMFNYYNKNKWGLKPRLLNATEVGSYAFDFLGNRTVEFFYLLCLDSLRYVNAFVEVEKGTVSSANINVRKVVECALKYRAHSVVLVHNHPAGSLHPSDDDLTVTAKLCKIFEELDIPVMDHIIVSGKGFTSLAERGLMPV